MARIDVPKIVRELPLTEYAGELEGVGIDVWVNPPKAMMVEISGLLTRAAELRKQPATAELAQELDRTGQEIMAWYSRVWSQGRDEARRISVEDVQRLFEQSMDTDPLLWGWVTSRTLGLIAEHRGTLKKG